MLLSVPNDIWGSMPWVLGCCVELAVAIKTWNIDHIPDHVHEATSAKWHIDPGATSISCRAPVEVGKLTGFAFGWSLLVQVVCVVAVKIVDRRRRLQRLHAQYASSYREGLDPLEGAPEVLYALHAVTSMAISGCTLYKAVDLFAWRSKRFRHCPHRKIVGLFRFSVFANGAIFAWYLLVSSTAIKVVFFDALAQSLGDFVVKKEGRGGGKCS